MDNMDDMNSIDDMDKTYYDTESTGFVEHDVEGDKAAECDERSGSINIQNVPVKKSRFKKAVPFIATAIIASVIGAAGGGAYANYILSKNTYTTPITSSTSQSNQTRTVSYTPPSSLIAKIAEEVGPAVVGISTEGVTKGFFGERTTVQGSGSGIIFDKSGYIVTNQHVIDGGKNITVTLAGDKSFAAQVIGADTKSDLAVLKINAGNINLPVANFGDSDKVRVGDLAVAIGNPLGQEYAGTVTSGIISALNRKMTVGDGEYDRSYELIQTDAAINPGNSGGALLNENGEVIGINSIKFVDDKVEGMGFAIPINDAKPIIDELMKNGYISRPQLGVIVVTIDEKASKEFNCPVGAGIEEVTRGGAAEAAGLKPGDVIVEANGIKITTNDDLIAELEKHKVGESIKLKIWREGQYTTIPVTLGEQRKQAS